MKILNSSNLMKTITSQQIDIQSTLQTPIPDKNIHKCNEESLEIIKKLTEERNEVLSSEAKAKDDLKESQLKVNELISKVKELEKKIIKDKATKTKPLTVDKKVQTDYDPKITPKESLSPKVQVTSTKPGTLSKPQLFNGIKRYLSNAMATLLKMEMFGNSEREWKADEKKISCEVMRLGKDVYEYFTDEWRLRLPSKSEVTNWLQDNADDEEEDIF